MASRSSGRRSSTTSNKDGLKFKQSRPRPRDHGAPQPRAGAYSSADVGQEAGGLPGAKCGCQHRVASSVIAGEQRARLRPLTAVRQITPVMAFGTVWATRLLQNQPERSSRREDARSAAAAAWRAKEGRSSHTLQRSTHGNRPGANMVRRQCGIFTTSIGLPSCSTARDRRELKFAVGHGARPAHGTGHRRCPAPSSAAPRLAWGDEGRAEPRESTRARGPRFFEQPSPRSRNRGAAQGGRDVRYPAS